MVNLEFSKNIHLKSENFKNPQCNIVRAIGRKIQDSLKTLVAICRRSRVLTFSLPRGPMLTKTNEVR